jgi:hypothetical protein
MVMRPDWTSTQETRKQLTALYLKKYLNVRENLEDQSIDMTIVLQEIIGGYIHYSGLAQ